MSTNLDDLNIGGQLQVGTGIPPAIKQGDEKINGSMHAEGPAVFGGPTEFSDNVATLMVGRTKNDDEDCDPADRSLYVKGNTKLEGDDGTSNALKVEGDQDNTGSITASDDITTKAHFIGDITQTSGTPPGCKLFDITHPNKEGYRLAHACIEGPEVGVYFRGKVRNKSVIQLPKYWKGLVDYTTITVNLTPIGAHQNVIVKRVDEDKIYLQAQGGMPINCYFHVFGTREDVERLTVEYEGTSPADYPGDNSAYSIAGYNYDVRS